MNRATILVVEDDERSRKLLHAFVTSCGHDPALAENGAMALQMMQARPPDMVLLDIMMPEMDGREVLRRMRGDDPLRHIPVVMITALSETESVANCIQEGADDYLTKPFNATILKARISACLEKKRLRDAERGLLEGTLQGSIKVLTEVLSLVHPAAFGRCLRLKRYVEHMVGRLGLADPWQYTVAAMLSQIGFVTLPPDLAQKVYAKEPLSERESELLAEHAIVARDLLRNIPRLQDVAEMIAKQHEPLSANELGSDPAKAEPIALGAQMLTVALRVDDLLSQGVTTAGAIARLQRKLAKGSSCLAAALEGLHAEAAQVSVSSVGLKDLRPGMLTAEEIRAKSGLLLVSERQEITPTIIQRLRAFAESVGIPEPVRVYVLQRVLGAADS